MNIYYSLLNNSFEEQLAFQNALKQYISSIDIEYAKSNKDFFVAFEGSFGNKHVTPRTLTSHYLGNLVCLEGIVTKCEYLQKENVYVTFIPQDLLNLFKSV